MENPIGKIENWIKFLKPLPNPEIEENKFLGGLQYLSQKEIRSVIETVIEEIKLSRNHGLFINDELIEKEEAFFLIIFNSHKGISRMVRDEKFEDLSLRLGDLMAQFFEPEAKAYFEQFKDVKGGSRARYNDHLHSLKGTLLNKAYNGLLS